MAVVVVVSSNKKVKFFHCTLLKQKLILELLPRTQIVCLRVMNLRKKNFTTFALTTTLFVRFTRGKLLLFHSQLKSAIIKDIALLVFAPQRLKSKFFEKISYETAEKYWYTHYLVHIFFTFIRPLSDVVSN